MQNGVLTRVVILDVVGQAGEQLGLLDGPSHAALGLDQAVRVRNNIIVLRVLKRT